MTIERFEDIEVWQLARELTRKVYRLTKKPGFAKDYGLKRQVQDVAGSSMHNVAEGFDSETNAEFIRVLAIRQAVLHRSPERTLCCLG
jgi:four helix bundle protein